MPSWRSFLLTMRGTIVFPTKNVSQTYEHEKTTKMVKDEWSTIKSVHKENQYTKYEQNTYGTVTQPA
jgi:hypothetical protein